MNYRVISIRFLVLLQEQPHISAKLWRENLTVPTKKKHAIYKKEFMIPSWGRKEKKLQMTSINRIKQKTRENIFLIRKPWIPEINTPKNVINVFFDVQHIILSRYTSGVIFGTIYNPPFPRYDVRAKLEAIDQTVNKFDGTGLNKPSCRLKGQIDK